MAISPESLKILKLHFRRRLTDEDIAEEMNIDVKKVKTILAWYRRHPEEVNSAVTNNKEEEKMMNITPKIQKIIDLYNAGETTSEIAMKAGVPKGSVTSTIFTLRQQGYKELREAQPRKAQSPKIAKDALGSTQTAKEVGIPAESPDLLPQPQDAQAFKASDPAPEPAIQEAATLPQEDQIKPTPTKSPAVLPTPSATGLDPSTIHSLIDVALKMPELKKNLLHYADELETAALYIQSMAKEIREKISA